MTRFPPAFGASTRAVPLALTALSVLCALLAAGCGGKETASAAPAASAPKGPPPPAVGVVTTALAPVALQSELPGRVEALRVALVRARANGVVQKRLFREGSDVKAGQMLFRIDPAPYQAAADSARATLARAEASLAQSKAQAERYKPLVEANAVSKQDYVNAVAAQKAGEADVAAAKAALQSARISLDYASVAAPISGRIGRALVTEGALVSAAEATQLATIQQVDSVYVNFTQSAVEALRLRKDIAAKKLEASGDGAAIVHVFLEDGTELPRTGKLLFTDLTVDATSGQVTLRAEVPNPDNLLLPGQYVRVRLSQAALPAGILLPQQAVTRTDRGDTVLVVGAENKPAPRNVKVGLAQNNQWVVLDGLKPGEQVIVDGFQKMMVPGAPVQPVPWQGGAASASAGGASAAAGAPAAASAGSPGTAASAGSPDAAAPAGTPQTAASGAAPASGAASAR